MKKEIEYGSILESNDKLFTGKKKPRKVVVTKVDKESKKPKGVSRVLSLKGKDGKANSTLVPIKKYPSIPEESGVDYRIYTKTKEKKSLNFGSMRNTGDVLDEVDKEKVKKHVKKRGGKGRSINNKNYTKK